VSEIEKVIRDGEAGRRGVRSHKVTFTLDLYRYTDILALKGLSYDVDSRHNKLQKEMKNSLVCRESINGSSVPWTPRFEL